MTLKFLNSFLIVTSSVVLSAGLGSYAHAQTGAYQNMGYAPQAYQAQPAQPNRGHIIPPYQGPSQAQMPQANMGYPQQAYPGQQAMRYAPQQYPVQPNMRYAPQAYRGQQPMGYPQQAYQSQMHPQVRAQTPMGYPPQMYQGQQARGMGYAPQAYQTPNMMGFMPQAGQAHHAHNEPTPFVEGADAWADITASWTKAKQAGKLTIVVMGSNSCHDSRALAGQFLKPHFQPLLTNSYEVVYVDVGEKNRNIDIAQRFGLPGIVGTPTVIILSPDGRVMNLDTAPTWRNAASRSDQDVMAYFTAFARMNPMMNQTSMMGQAQAQMMSQAQMMRPGMGQTMGQAISPAMNPAMNRAYPYR